MANETGKRTLDYRDKQDFDDCTRGYIDIEYPPTIQREDGHIIWDTNAFVPHKSVEYDPDKTPNNVNKSLWRQAHLNKYNGWFQVCEGVYQFRGYDIANLTLVETRNGIVVIDCTTSREIAETALDLYRNHIAKSPESTHVMAVIFTHTHTDHYGGIEGVTGGDGHIPIYAPENFVTEAALENVIVGDSMTRRSTYQYGTFLKSGESGHVDSGLGKGMAKGGTVGFAVPTHIVVTNPILQDDGKDKEPVADLNRSSQHLVYERTRQKIDGVAFEFILCPHTEAPAEMSVYIPAKKVLVAAEIATHTLHNTLTPRGAEVRDARLWWKALDKLLERYGGNVTCICATHHWPIWENGRCKRFLEQQRDTYKFLHDQTVRLINRGYTMLEIAAWFDDEDNLPDFMVNQWHNRGYYGTISHDVRAIYQKYLGWYDMNPANLNPLPPREAAKRYIAAMGGGEKVYFQVMNLFYDNNVRNLSEQNIANLRWAAELGKHLVLDSPDLNPGYDIDRVIEDARYVLAKIFTTLALISEAGTWRDMYLVGAEELREGRALNPDARSTVNPAILGAVEDELLFDYMASRINPEAATDLDRTIDVFQKDRISCTRLEYACRVLNFHQQTELEKKTDSSMERGSEKFVRLETTRDYLVKMIQGMSVEKAVDEGGAAVRYNSRENDIQDIKYVQSLFSLIDHTFSNFQIVLPLKYEPEK